MVADSMESMFRSYCLSPYQKEDGQTSDIMVFSDIESIHQSTTVVIGWKWVGGSKEPLRSMIGTKLVHIVTDASVAIDMDLPCEDL